MKTQGKERAYLCLYFTEGGEGKKGKRKGWGGGALSWPILMSGSREKGRKKIKGKCVQKKKK